MADVLIKKRQIEPLDITDSDIDAAANIATSKLADGSLFIKSDGTVEYTASQSMGLNKLTDLAAPTNPNDAVRLTDLQNAASGIDIHDPVVTTSVSNITLSGLQTIEGVTVAAGDRVLVQGQTDPKANGIYLANSSTWTRASDADETGELKNGTKVLVQQGDHAGSTYICTGINPITIGTSDIPWVQDSQSILYSAGSGLTLTGTTFAVGTVSSSRIKVNATNIDLATTGVTAGTYFKVTTDAYGRVTAGDNPTTVSGFGITDVYTQTQIGNYFNGTTSMTGYNKTNWDNASNAQITGVTFNTATGVLTLSTKDTTNFTQSLDGRYSLLGHTHALSDLTDTTITTPATGNLLQYNGTKWVNWAPTYISGNQTINFAASGDVTGSTSGTTSLAPTLTIGAKKVTYAKIQDISSQSLLGRYASTDGQTQEITLGTGLSLSNTTGVLSATGTGGTVTSIAAGNGMSFSTITSTGTITLGTPSAITLSSSNSVTSTSHTHAFVPGGTTSQYIDGTGALQDFGASAGVNNGTLTLATSGIATGSATFSANQSTAATFTVNVPATNLSLTGTTGALTITSSTGTSAIIPLATTSASGLLSPSDKTKLDSLTSGASVSSVGLTVPSILSVSGSPITTTGTFAVTLATQAPNTVFAGPATGSTNTAPTFRALTSADIPVLDTSKITTGTFSTARLGSGTASSSTYLTGTGWVSIPSIPQGTVTSVAMSVPTGFAVTGSPITSSGTLVLSFASGYSLPTTANQTIWTNKQNQLNGTGFVKVSGTTVSYDNSTYLTAESDTLQSVTNRGNTTSKSIVAGATTSATTTIGSGLGTTIDVGTITGSWTRGIQVQRDNSDSSKKIGIALGAYGASDGSVAYAYLGIDNTDASSLYSTLNSLRLYSDGSLYYGTPPANSSVATKFLGLSSDGHTISTRTAAQVASDIGALTSFTETDPVWTAAKSAATSISGAWNFTGGLNVGQNVANGGGLTIHAPGSYTTFVGGAFGHTAASMLTSNASPTYNSDLWTQAYTPVPSSLLELNQAGYLKIYTAAAGKTADTFTNFWGTGKVVATQDWVTTQIPSTPTLEQVTTQGGTTDKTISLTNTGIGLIISGGTAVPNAVQFTSAGGNGTGGYIQGSAVSTPGYGIFTNSNAYFDGTNWIQPRGTSVGSHTFGVTHHHDFTWQYAAPNGTNGATITPVEIMNLNSAGALTVGAIGSYNVAAIGSSPAQMYTMFTGGSASTNRKWSWGLLGSESGSNAGANLQLYAYGDTGSVILNPLSITRSTGAVTFSASITAGSIIRYGGASSQFLKADGSVDSSTYLTSVPTASSTVLGGIKVGSGLSIASGVLSVSVTGAEDWVCNEVLSGTVNGTNKIFTLANTPITGTVTIFLNGVALLPGAGNGYTISGQTVTTTIAPVIGEDGTADVITGQYFKS